ncbi:protein of unknown function [Thermomonospora echinospora]|uniref:DUF4328 domain-containing protein n=1 Tax=Thermomonospora echinospora TaxID=1992 RepID=A0A1H6DQB9_9ACTN|nr:DUF4328 domain-containing protein [Thermomonospora echinospora]SEG87441.1 protein of unknown function [Thermomonospora echinospora]
MQPSPQQVQAGTTGHADEGPVRPAWRLGALTMAMLGVWTVVALASMVVLGLHVRRLDDAAQSGGPSVLEVSDALPRLALLAQAVAVLCTAVLFVLWLRRAYDNAERIMHLPQRFGRPWVTYGWIIPVAHLWAPKLIVDDVWAASTGRASGHDRRWVTAWWVCWLVYLVGGNFALSLDDDGDLAAERTQAIVSILLIVPGLAAAALAATLIWKINTTQQAQGDRMAAATATTTPPSAPRPGI